MKKTSQDGIAHLGLFLLLVVAVVVGFAGYKVMQSHNNSAASTNSSTAPVANQTVQTIKTTADLSSVETSLNSQNIDSDLNPSGFNQDVSNLL